MEQGEAEKGRIEKSGEEWGWEKQREAEYSSVEQDEAV